MLSIKHGELHAFINVILLHVWAEPVVLCNDWKMWSCSGSCLTGFRHVGKSDGNDVA